MPMTFKETPELYAVGRPANMEAWNGITRTLETDVQLGFGAPVGRGTGDHGCVPYTGSEDFLGVSACSQVLGHPGDYYSQYDNVGIYPKEVLGANTGENEVAAGSPAAWDSDNSVWLEADSSNPQVPGCEFETSGTGVVLIRVRRPVPTA